ncbi:reverse transcriptase domain-containing protein, partial [Thiolapillus sp.]|uniref:reverse transcriptase domain-containing protein n=1 Tax=Thiolapillus sp. TaxID=2017437 RepID=UPI003AF79FC7
MRQIQDLTPHTSTSTIDAVHARGHKQCGNCGGSHAPRQCPAYGTTCSKCHKKNHWRQVCRSGGGATPSSNSSTRNATFQQKKKKRGGLPHRNYGQWRKTVNAITDDSGDDYSSDLEHLEFSSIEKDSGDDRDELYASLDIIYKRPASLKVKVDTGAQGNILPLRIFRRMFPERLNPNGFPAEGTTETRRTILHAYNGTPIKQFGVINLSCKYRDSDWQNAEFFVTESEGSAILGLPSSRQLRLVTVHCAVQKVSTSKKQPIKDASHLKHMYPDRFEGIGDFEGELHITLQEGAKAVVQPPRKYPIQLLDEIKSELEKMERLDVITPVTEPTDWVNALAFSRKSSGGLRVCLDPRSLNKCIKRTHYKTPTLEEITNRLSGSKVFSKLDAKHGYWSIKLDEESSKLTTFNSPCGRFRFKRLPFGLNLSQDAFQRSMDRILIQCPGTIGITDDVIVHGKDEEDHDKNLHHLMQVAQKCGLVFNIDKCKIKTPQIKFFGMIYDADGVHPDPTKCAEIQALPSPKNMTELQQFLGIVQYMSSFIPRLADHTAPLRAMTKKDSKFEWNDSLQQAFERVKSMICEDMSLS